MRFNHMFTIAFSLVNDSPTGEATGQELLRALHRRIRFLEMDPESVIEACGAPDDTYELDDSEDRPVEIRYMEGLCLVAAQNWFIENISSDHPDCAEIFRYLRDRYRKEIQS